MLKNQGLKLEISRPVPPLVSARGFVGGQEIWLLWAIYIILFSTFPSNLICLAWGEKNLFCCELHISPLYFPTQVSTFRNFWWLFGAQCLKIQSFYVEFWWVFQHCACWTLLSFMEYLRQWKHCCSQWLQFAPPAKGHYSRRDAVFLPEHDSYLKLHVPPNEFQVLLKVDF